MNLFSFKTSMAQFVVSISLILLTIILLDAAQARVGKNECPENRYLLPNLQDYDHLKYAPAERERLYNGGTFISSVDSIDDDNGDGKEEYLVQPNWVAYHLKSFNSNRGSNYAPSYRRPKNWYRLKLFNEEREHYKTNQNVGNSYLGMGHVWNRGHLSQRADSNRITPEFGCNTHVFSNAVPQSPKFNRGIWQGMENYVSSLSNERGELWVVTGPVYEKEKIIQFIGEREKKEIPVAVPDKLFKVIFMESERGVEVISLIYPNKFDKLPTYYKEGNCQQDKQYDHTPYIVSLKDVEDATGLTFFSGFEMDLSEFKKIKATILPTVGDEYRVGYCL